jgi:tRNA dimethylallyltransferase
MQSVLAILGPTASGKSDLAVRIAERCGGEIISCDAMQVYRGMDIGTAKPAAEERNRIRHHMIDIVSPAEPYSAARYARDAMVCLAGIQSRGVSAVAAGGTGFYWRGLHRGVSSAPPGDPAIRAELSAEDSDTLFASLKKTDPVTAERLAVNDRRRVIRALEVARIAGRPLSSFREYGNPRFAALIIGLRLEREELYRRIEDRVDAMIRAGLLNEIDDLKKTGFSKTAAQAIGYKEFLPVLSGETALSDAVEACKQNTRRYAKRQITWLKKEPDIRWLGAAQPNLADIVMDLWLQFEKNMI